MAPSKCDGCGQCGKDRCTCKQSMENSATNRKTVKNTADRKNDVMKRGMMRENLRIQRPQLEEEKTTNKEERKKQKENNKKNDAKNKRQTWSWHNTFNTWWHGSRTSSSYFKPTPEAPHQTVR